MATMSEVIAERRTTLQISSEELAVRINEPSSDRVGAFEAGTLVLDEGTECRLLTALGFSAAETAALQKGPRVPPLRTVLLRRRTTLGMDRREFIKGVPYTRACAGEKRSHWSANRLERYERGLVILRPKDVRNLFEKLGYSADDIDRLCAHELAYWPHALYAQHDAEEAQGQQTQAQQVILRSIRDIHSGILWDNLQVLRAHRDAILARPEYYHAAIPVRIFISKAFIGGGHLCLGDCVALWFADGGSPTVKPCPHCGKTMYCIWAGGGLGSTWSNFLCPSCNNVCRGEIDASFGEMYRRIHERPECTALPKNCITILRELGAPVEQALLDRHNLFIRDNNLDLEPLLYPEQAWVYPNGDTRLNRACQNGDIATVCERLENGDDINGGAHPPLIDAIEHWNEDLLRLLLERGAAVSPAVLDACEEKVRCAITRYEWALGLFYECGMARERLAAYANVLPPGAAYVPEAMDTPSLACPTFSLKKGGRQYPVSILLGEAKHAPQEQK